MIRGCQEGGGKRRSGRPNAWWLVHMLGVEDNLGLELILGYFMISSSCRKFCTKAKVDRGYDGCPRE